MCGRTACTLAPDEICKACSLFVKKQNQFVVPSWKDHPGNHEYYPSPNMAPSKFSPVLIKAPTSSCKRDIEGNSKKEVDSYIIQPMMWGLIPAFFKGDSPSGYSYKTNNCRIETIEEKRTYIPSLNKGQRCVVLCDGFYEWQTTKGDKDKQPYFIHSPQPEWVEIWNKETYNLKTAWDKVKGWKGPQLLKMAGLYAQWISNKGEEFYSYSVITMESGGSFSGIHHRIPAIFENLEDAKDWLDSSILDNKLLFSKFSSNPNISLYPVSSLVNNSRNQDSACMVPTSLDTKKKAALSSSKMMSNWLSTSSSSSPSVPKKHTDEKKCGNKEQKNSILKWIKKEEKK